MLPSSEQNPARLDSGAEEAGVSHIPGRSGTDLPVGGMPAPREIGGREGPEPTRFGDWEKNGRCIDF